MSQGEQGKVVASVDQEAIGRRRTNLSKQMNQIVGPPAKHLRWAFGGRTEPIGELPGKVLDWASADRVATEIALAARVSINAQRPTDQTPRPKDTANFPSPPRELLSLKLPMGRKDAAESKLLGAGRRTCRQSSVKAPDGLRYATNITSHVSASSKRLS